MNNNYINLNEAINYIYDEASKMAIEGVKTGKCGPFGAGIIKKDGNYYKIITINHNSVVLSHDPTAHAEINAIRSACNILNTNDLSDCILVTTAKSCPMCLSAAIWANIKTIYYSESYDSADTSGFRDSKIEEYIQGKNSIICEIQLKNENTIKPFIEWNNKKDKISY